MYSRLAWISYWFSYVSSGDSSSYRCRIFYVFSVARGAIGIVSPGNLSECGFPAFLS